MDDILKTLIYLVFLYIKSFHLSGKMDLVSGILSNFTIVKSLYFYSQFEMSYCLTNGFLDMMLTLHLRDAT